MTRLLLIASLLFLSAQPATAEPTWTPTPAGRGAITPVRTFDTEHLLLELDLDIAGGRVSGTATHRLKPLTPDLKDVVFDQRGLTFHAVTVNGKDAPYDVEFDSLHITLPAYKDGDVLTIGVHYAATPQTGLHFRRPQAGSPDQYSEVWSQGEGEDHHHWFPLRDSPDDRFTFEAVFTAPEGFAVASNGTLVEQKGFSWHYKMDDEIVSYLVAVAAARYDIHHEDWDGTPLEYWVPPGTPKSHLTNTVGQTAKILQWFSERTGARYPYDIYRQIFVQRFLYTGMENTTATIQERRILHPDSVRATRGWPQEVVAHEIAHQWYGDWLTCRAWRELWLNEGFATFMASDWGEYRFGKPHLARAVLNRIRGIEDGSRHPMVRRHWLPGDHGVNHDVYRKGALTLQALRVLVGEEAFWEGVRRYTKAHSNRLVETDDLRRAFEEVTGQHLSWFFEQWVYHIHVPAVSVSQSFSDGQLQVTLKQTVSDTAPAFSLPVDVRIPVDGEDITRRLWLTDGDPAVLSLSLAEAPPYVVIDEHGGLIAKLEQEQSTEAWIAQLADQSAFARIRAVRALAKGERTEEAVTALIKRLQDDELHWVERQEAADALGKLRTGEGVLIQTLINADDRLRESSAAALGQMVRSEAISNALAERIQKDPNADVRATAIRSLGPIDPERALKIARKQLKSANTPNQVVEQAAVRLLGARGDDRDFGTVTAIVGDDDNSYRFRTTAAWAAARQVARADSAATRRAMRVTLSRALEPWLTDLHQRARETAVHLLAEVGDRDAIPALDALAHTTTLENLRKSAINAQKQIRSRSDEIDEPNEAELIARIEALEKRLDAVDKKLESTREWH